MKRPERFVNRVKELHAFLGEIGQPRHTNRVVILEGVSGVGKSSFTRRLLEQQRNGPGIKVPLMSGASPDGYLIAETARAVSESSVALGVTSLQQYMTDLPPGSEMRRRYHARLLDQAANLDPTQAAGVAITIVRRKLGAGDFNADNLFRSFYGEGISLLADYLKHVLGERRLILNIENVQDADRVSLLLLRELLTVQKGHYLVLEYTPGEGTANEQDELLSLLRETGSSVDLYGLKKLPFEDVLQLISDGDVVQMLERAYVTFDGNLRAITDLDIVVAQGLPSLDKLSPSSISESTPLRIERLNKAAVFSLACVVTHRGTVKMQLLYRLYGSHEFLRDMFIDFDTAFADLESEEMVRMEHGSVTVAHDSISRAMLEAPYFQRYVIIAYEAWSRVYTEINDRREYVFVTRSETLFYLFHFYAQTDAGRLLRVLDEVREVALESLRPTAALPLLEQLRGIVEARTQARATELERVVYLLLDLYYLLGLYEQGLKMLQGIDRRTPQRDIYHAALLISQDRDVEAVSLLEGFLDEPCSPEPWYEFFLHFFLMVGYRCVERIDDCNHVFRNILNDAEYSKLTAYGLLLRNAEIVMENEEAIPYLQESIRFLYDRGLTVAEAESRISLGVNYTIAGQLDHAMTELNTADQLLWGRSMKRHIILNDKAAVLLLRDPPDAIGAVELLTNALRTVTVGFDRIVVLNNLLIAQALRGNTGILEDLERELVSRVAQHTFADLHRITYINLSFASAKIGSHGLAEYYLSHARGLGDGGDAYFAARLFGTPLPDTDREFMSNFPFRPAFLANWDTELSDFIPFPN
jgi:tetratricopeptide (TPR) repeat protein